MIICYECQKEMYCKRNGMIATWHKTHRYAGDLFACKSCEAKVLVTNPKPYHSTDPIEPENEVKMGD